MVELSDWFVFVGYGDVKYESVDVVGIDVFLVCFVLIFLFSLNDKMYVEVEFEVGLNEDGEIEIEFEYVDIYYFLNDNMIIIVGKFLLLFG